MTPYVQHVRFRKFCPVAREYPIFELVEGDDVLLDVSSSDAGVLEVALHEARCPFHKFAASYAAARL
jgi:hypothetical protein